MKREDVELQQDVDRMNNVERIVNNPEYQKAFLILKAHIMTEFSKLNYKKVDDMQEANRQLKTLDRLEAHFNGILTNGKVAEKTLSQRLKRVIGL
jgi:hypothetical protein